MKPALLDPPKRATPYGVDGQPVRPSFADGLTTEEITELLGPIPAWRVRNWPPPGTATFADAVACADRGETVELYDGVLLEKTMGMWESVLAGRIADRMRARCEARNLGIVAGADGPIELPGGQSRMPDALFVGWEGMPGGFDPAVAVPDLPPTIACEVISASNTRREMERKLLEYFGGGAKLVWYVYPRTRTVRVYTAADDFTILSAEAGDVLTAGDVLPGFELPLADLFSPPTAPASQPAGVQEGPDAGQELLDGHGGQ